jgi:hypothetical protein
MRQKLPNRRVRTPIEFTHDGHNFRGGAGHYPNGDIGEVFLSAGKTGTALSILISDAAVAASIAIQYGAPIDVLRKAFMRNEDGSAAGPMAKLFDIMEDRK